MSTSDKGYHHGDLRAALLDAAIEGLESDEPFSLRAVARRAGVSAAAPYRHFADRSALEAAIAVDGFAQLRAELEGALAQASASEGDPAAAPHPEATLSALAVAYVAFALRRPAVFRLMFGNECDPADSDRVRASQALHDLLRAAIADLFPGADPVSLSTALWSTAHGLAFLHLDGKFRPDPSADVEARIRAAITALFVLPAPAPTLEHQELRS